MKILIMLLSLAIATPACWAADTKSAAPAAKTEAAKTDAAKDGEARDGAKSGDAAKGETGGAEKEPETPPNEFSCKYYTVKLPDGWRAIMPPTEQAGVTNAIFSKTSDKTTVSLLVGKSGGADTKTIASMFAEQLKAPKPPVEKNGQYVFQYPQHEGMTADVSVIAAPHEFMVITTTGNAREARNFIRDCIKSEDYKDLLPQ